ncbi:OmpL47-type beta-barrel domain-containing protein [Brevibacillus sp. NPDC058079]|uniref:OmpL47-type beta-barrel domain-containing protein n=1 Tax=Brevibacillus sp. NPDC058079 TaxID=3346330 RepID=UPI0036E25895
MKEKKKKHILSKLTSIALALALASPIVTSQITLPMIAHANSDTISIYNDSETLKQIQSSKLRISMQNDGKYGMRLLPSGASVFYPANSEIGTTLTTLKENGTATLFGSLPLDYFAIEGNSIVQKRSSANFTYTLRVSIVNPTIEGGYLKVELEALNKSGSNQTFGDWFYWDTMVNGNDKSPFEVTDNGWNNSSGGVQVTAFHRNTFNVVDANRIYIGNHTSANNIDTLAISPSNYTVGQIISPGDTGAGFLWEPQTIEAGAIRKSSVIVGLGPRNATPTFTMTSPGDNQTYYRGQSFQIIGTAKDTDIGDTMSVKWAIDGGTENVLSTIVANGQNQAFSYNYTLPNNLADGKHTLQVWVMDNKGGVSSANSRTFIVNNFSIPGQPLFSNVSNNSMTVSWDKKGNVDTTTYELVNTTNSNATINTGNSNTYNVKGLSPNTLYMYKVRAKNTSNVYTAYSAEGTIVTLANPLISGEFSRNGNVLDVTWNPNGNPTGTKYQYELRNSSGVVVKNGESTSSSANISLSGLTGGDYGIFVRAINQSGVATSYLSIGTVNADVTPPNIPSITGKSGWQKDNQTVSIENNGDNVGGSGVGRIEYSLSGATTVGWTIYNAPLSITTEGITTVSARAIDKAGNISSVHTKLVQIDKTAPVVSLTSTNQTPSNLDAEILVSSDDTMSGVAVKKYAPEIQSASFFESGGTVISGNTFKVSLNGTYSVYVKDNAGNETIQTIEVKNVDKTPPSIALVPSTTDPTNQSITVSVNITDNENGVIVQKYAVGNQNVGFFANSGTILRGNTFEVSANGIYTVYAKDAANNESMKTITITNIDKTNPTTPSITLNGNVLMVSPGTDIGSGVHRTLIQINGSQWSAYATPITLQDGEYTIHVKTIDKAGNESSVATLTKVINVKGLENATKAVEDAEKNMDQVNVDRAKDLIGALPNIVEKEILLHRLEVVQKTIELKVIEQQLVEIEGKINSGEIGKDNILTFKDKMKLLESKTKFLPSYLNTEEAKRKIDSINEQLKWIEKVFDLNENSPVNIIEELEKHVLGMENGLLKDRLIEHLNKVNGYSKALEQVEKAENTLDENDIHRANVLIYYLKEGNSKEELIKRINRVKVIVDATKYVVLTEKTLTLSDFTRAIEMVEKVENTSTKSQLMQRLNAVQKVVETIDLVSKAEQTHLQSDINLARIEVSKLPKGSIQDGLHIRLDRYDAALNMGQSKVRMAEINPTTAIVKEAEEAINKVFESPQKLTLVDRLTVVKKQLEDKLLSEQLDIAKKKVAKAEEMKRDPYLTDAWTVVNALPPGSEKEALVARMNALIADTDSGEGVKDPLLVEKIKKATDKVKLAEMYKRDPYVTDARKLVTDLPAGAEKDALLARLNAVSPEKQPTDPTHTPEYKAAEAKVKKAETYKRNPYLSDAEAAIMSLPEGAGKDALISRVEAVKRALEAEALAKQVVDATKKVESAEKYKRDPYIRTAQEAVDQLPAGADKNALQNRMDKLKDPGVVEQTPLIEKAEKTVAMYEKYRYSAYQKKAQESVDQLVNGSVKSAFQTRIDAVDMK